MVLTDSLTVKLNANDPPPAEPYLPMQKTLCSANKGCRVEKKEVADEKPSFDRSGGETKQNADFAF